MQLCKLLHLHRQNVQHLKSLHAHITPENEEEAEILNASYSGSYLAITIVTIQ